MKRDYLIDIEKKVQQKWAEEKVFEVDPPTQAELSSTSLSPTEIQAEHPKWMGTFPCVSLFRPLLSAAQALTSLCFPPDPQLPLHERLAPPRTRLYDLQDRVRRRLPAHARQARALPHGFPRHRHAHQGASALRAFLCSSASADPPAHARARSLALQSAADKLIREMELFGEDFERFDPDEPVPTPSAKPAPASDTPKDPSKATKGKLNAKSTGLTHQFQIMESIGVPRAEIKKFADPLHWLDFFPPIAKEDCDNFGARIDWRRSFLVRRPRRPVSARPRQEPPD